MEKKTKIIIGVAAGIAITVGGVWAYKKYYAGDSEEKEFQPVGGKQLDLQQGKTDRTGTVERKPTGSQAGTKLTKGQVAGVGNKFQQSFANLDQKLKQAGVV